MRALLIYNPTSGKKHRERAARIEEVAALLAGHGYELQITATTHPGSAAQQVREAIATGTQVVFACGGDGTVHDVLQGLAGTVASLGIIPLGSANALCRELGIPKDARQAALAYKFTQDRLVLAASCATPLGERSFLSMAGAGPDGALMYRMLAVNRGRWGRWAYAAHAVRMLFGRRFATFQIEYAEQDGDWHRTHAVSAMLLRIGSLGGIFPGIARGASLDGETMRLVLVKAPATLGLPLWFLSSWLRVERWNPLLESVMVEQVVFKPGQARVDAQADGEWIGSLPMHAKLDKGKLVRFLIPVGAARRS